MTPTHFKAEMNYLAARQIAEQFLKQALLKPEEFERINALLITRFQPPLGKLFSDIAPDTTCNLTGKE